MKTNLIFEGLKIWYDHKGYACVWMDNKSIKVHVLVWERVYGRKPPKHDIHHKDFDKSNYQLENLELLTWSDHRRVHAGWVKENNQWVKKPCTRCHQILPLDSFYPRRTANTPSALCKPCSNTASILKNRSPEYKDRRKRYNQKWYANKQHRGLNESS